MPHSPRYHQGFVYVCESGSGTVWKYDPKTGKNIEFAHLPGFTRGISFLDGLMFVGLSKIRTSETKKKIPLSTMYEETFAGVWIINLKDGSEIAHVKFSGDVEQIYDIAVVPNTICPELLQGSNSLIRHIFDYKEKML